MNKDDVKLLSACVKPLVCCLIDKKKKEVIEVIDEDTDKAYLKIREIKELEYLRDNCNKILRTCEGFESGSVFQGFPSSMLFCSSGLDGDKFLEEDFEDTEECKEE